MHEAGLYFPYVQVRDDDWLKLAMLYWPRIYRIVPPGYPMQESRTAREFRRAGLLGAVEPNLGSDASPKVEVIMGIDFFAALAKTSGALDTYSTARARAEFDGRPSFGPPPDDRLDRALGWLHSTKVSFADIFGLRRAGLAEYGPRLPLGEQWVGLHPALAGAYMTALANQIAGSLDLQPLTDQADLRIVAPNDGVASALDLLVGRSPDRPSEPAAVDEYVMLALECVRPKTLGGVSAKQIIRCRKNLVAELADFRAFVEQQNAELAAITSLPPGQRKLDAFADHVRDTVEAPLQRLERGLQLHKLDTVRTMLVTGTLATPPLASLGLDHLGAGSTIGMSVATVAGMGAAWWQVHAARESVRRSSPLSYLLDVRDELTPKTIAGRFQRIVKGSY
jgi:hypothetical protein